MASTDNMMETARSGIGRVIAASSAGTLIEWYDFYIFGTLATLLASKFFPEGNPTAALLATLATFATGFVVRPFGAIFFGRMGDLVGRKHTFLLTLLLMGGSTALIGVLPTYASIGVAAPILLVALRLVQGLALGGEYGGAATYVAEHAPDGRRGYYTSYIQTTATLGLLLSLAVIVGLQERMGVQAFEAEGWRIPFLISIGLVVFSFLIRRTLLESPMYAEMRAKGKGSDRPLRDSFLDSKNRRLVLLALFGATAGQGVVWYTGQFYVLYFLRTVLNFDLKTSSLIVGAALLLATPFFILFGALSDRVGRKGIMMAGCMLAAVFYIPIYRALVYASGFRPDLGLAVGAPDYPMLVALVFVQVLFVTMVYGPIAAFLVELFPTRIRYTSMSLPYHIGNGVFGGLVPLVGTASVAWTGNIYAGLVYPIVVAGSTFAVGTLLVRENREVALAEG